VILRRKVQEEVGIGEAGLRKEDVGGVTEDGLREVLGTLKLHLLKTGTEAEKAETVYRPRETKRKGMNLRGGRKGEVVKNREIVSLAWKIEIFAERRKIPTENLKKIL